VLEDKPMPDVGPLGCADASGCSAINCNGVLKVAITP